MAALLANCCNRSKISNFRDLRRRAGANQRESCCEKPGFLRRHRSSHKKCFPRTNVFNMKTAPEGAVL
jgi:hypothetical protein